MKLPLGHDAQGNLVFMEFEDRPIIISIVGETREGMSSYSRIWDKHIARLK